MTVTLTVRETLGVHNVVKLPGFWFCPQCEWFSVNVPQTVNPPGCPNEVIWEQPWPG